MAGMNGTLLVVNVVTVRDFQTLGRTPAAQPTLLQCTNSYIRTGDASNRWNSEENVILQTENDTAEKECHKHRTWLISLVCL